jgi:hypothetical protein
MCAGWINRARRGVAGLLVLALLALSVAPASAWPAPAADHSGELHAAAADCGSHGHAAVPAPPDQEPQRGHHDRLPPALACCLALHCPMLLADLRPAPAAPLPPAGLRVRTIVMARRPAGVDIAPALPPPREAA